jgi:hypothetical protein
MCQHGLLMWLWGNCLTKKPIALIIYIQITMSKKTITKAEFTELSKVMEPAEIIKQYNLEDQIQPNIIAKILTLITSTFGILFGKSKLVSKFLIPILLLSLTVSGYYGFQKYNEQIAWYKGQIETLENNLKYSKDSQKQIYELWRNDTGQKDSQIKKLKEETEKVTGELYSKVHENAEVKYPINVEIAKKCINQNLKEIYMYSCKTNKNTTIECGGDAYVGLSNIAKNSHFCNYEGELYICTIDSNKTKIIQC